jgi:membrane carboxypeptidase/penicillin-binding protein
MKRKRLQRGYQQPKQQFPTLPYAALEANAVTLIGMYCVKTIRDRNGNIIIRQGEKIRQEILTKQQTHEVLPEIIANAMPKT